MKRTLTLTVLLITMLSSCLLAEKVESANLIEAKPQRQMLFKIFAPIMHDLGSCNLQKAKAVSGPIEMKMTNNKQPGKQWRVRLGQSKFKVTIEDSTDMKLATALAHVERIPIAYRRALEVVSEDKKAGLAFYKTLGGAAAHGGQSYLNMIPLKSDHAASVIAHESGHVLEQRARDEEKDILDRWAEAAKADNIDVSSYGNHANHEDLAEFARLYAFCIDDAIDVTMKNELQKLSPKRFELWEHILRTSNDPASATALPAKNAVPGSDAKPNKHADDFASATVREKMEPKIKEVLETIKGLQNHDPK